ncbi:unnamed protein product [Brassicogethes aeneus]|uniref:Iron-binding zinc finger CDGSH type domain-containing protein n=1 Tax=Brassicogethes aeneus TaxID=1431903 RepID=A0A9P0ASP5_BRAAE|nr:unnamed protein product [Brassicogethes aeneus]
MALFFRNLLKTTPNKIICTNIINKCFYSKTGPDLPKNGLGDKISADKQQENGQIYDKKPFKVALEAGKRYSWCLCGRSKSQPFCDGTHKQQQLKITQKPVRFCVAESKDYWICNCKHTNNRPFCDGTHKSKVVQEGNSIIRQ